MSDNIITPLVFSVSCKTMGAVASQVRMGLYNITRIDTKLQFVKYFHSPDISILFQDFHWTQYTLIQKVVSVNHFSLSLLFFSPKCLIFLRISCWF